MKNNEAPIEVGFHSKEQKFYTIEEWWIYIYLKAKKLQPIIYQSNSSSRIKLLYVRIKTEILTYILFEHTDRGKLIKRVREDLKHLDLFKDGIRTKATRRGRPKKERIKSPRSKQIVVGKYGVRY